MHHFSLLLEIFYHISPECSLTSYFVQLKKILKSWGKTKSLWTSLLFNQEKKDKQIALK